MAARKTHNGGGFHRVDPWALTPKETRIMQLLDEGKSHAEVAAIINVKSYTLHHNLAHIRDKFLVDTNGEALAKWRAKAKR